MSHSWVGSHGDIELIIATVARSGLETTDSPGNTMNIALLTNNFAKNPITGVV
jgi:hypothetical protein